MGNDVNVTRRASLGMAASAALVGAGGCGDCFVRSGLARVVPALICGVFALQALAIEYEWVPGSTSWADPASYTNKAVAAVNTVLPGASDDVDIPANCTATLDCDNANDLAAVNGIGRIRPMTSSSFFVVRVSKGKEATLNTKVNFDNTSSYAAWYKGGIVKRGTGTLILGSGTGYADYFTDITVEEGTLKLPQETSSWAWRWYDLIAVSNGATLFTCSTADKSVGNTLTAPYGLIGEGTVTNDCTTKCFLEILNNGRTWSHEFAGQLTGNIRLNNGRSRFDLTGTNNTFYGGIMAVRDSATTYPLETVMIGLKKIGNKADPASSAGRYNSEFGLGYRDTREWNRNHGSGYLYLGDGETTDKDFYVHASNNNTTQLAEEPNFFDAGVNGGLTLTGAFTMGDGYNQRFILAGSNANECVVAGPIKRKTADGTNYNWRIIKKGTGAWRFADVANTEMEGVFAVENGSLRYDSIAEAGTRCSLGYSTLLLEDYTGKIDDSRRVDYAFELGSTTDASADPVFEYTGSTKGWCFSRPIALKGSARLRHSGGGELRLANVKTLNAAAKTLTLDGDGEEAWLYNVLDSYGTLSLVKDGTGTWSIVGTNQISGSVAVKAGTLNLAHHRTPYTWFRWTHKETFSNWATRNAEIGIFDSNGARLNSDMTYCSASASSPAGAVNLPAGQVSVSTAGAYDGPANMINLFDNNATTHWQSAHRLPSESTGWHKATVDAPETWWSITMRLPDGSADPYSWDMLCAGSAYWLGLVSRACSLEGSADGIVWELLDAVEDSASATSVGGGKAVTWRFGAEAWSREADCSAEDISTHVTGKKLTPQYPLPAILADVTDIYVASNARFAVTGGTLALPSGITLTVDGSTGAGTIANMVIPANGTLDIVNMPSFLGKAEIPVTFENVEGLDNIAGWTLRVNGVVKPVSRMRANASADRIRLTKAGVVILVR